MSQRRYGQLSLADSVARRAGRSEVFLAKVQRLVDWAALEHEMKPIAKARIGAPGYPPLLMLKVLLLEQWYGLSDPGVEDALSDRLSFRRFVGLALDEAPPDHSTISRFRNSLARHGLTDRVFAEVLRQIQAQKLILRRGTMIDATLVEAAVNRPRKPKSQATADAAPAEPPAEPAPDAGAAGVPAAKAGRAPSKLVLSKLDPDARWSKKGAVRNFGYKGHIGVDRGSGIIRKRLFTPGNVADTTPADDLICGDERAVYADAAYDTHARRAALKQRGINDRISHRANKHHGLTTSQERRNRGIANRRSAIERVFAIAKRVMGWCRARYRGLARNAAHFDMICTALNLRRMAAQLP